MHTSWYVLFYYSISAIFFFSLENIYETILFFLLVFHKYNKQTLRLSRAFKLTQLQYDNNEFGEFYEKNSCQ